MFQFDDLNGSGMVIFGGERKLKKIKNCKFRIEDYDGLCEQRPEYLII